MEYMLLKYFFGIVFILAIIFAGIWIYNWHLGKTAPSKPDIVKTTTPAEAVAYFAGGCFWCTESDYEKLSGVKTVTSGYMGGNVQNPSYNDVVGGATGHREMVKVVYDPSIVTYRRLALELFRETDPTDSGGSFYDRGHQYTSAIYYGNEREKEVATVVKNELKELGVFDKPIQTSIEPVGTFWVAEDYHQDYYKKNPLPYKYYRAGSGRDKFIESVWGSGKYDYLFEEANMPEQQKDAKENTSANKWAGFQKPDDATLRQTLTPLQYKVTQKDDTEPPFQNEYWDNHAEGIYVDIVSGEPLFSSTDKFDSDTGWPSFLKPIDYDFVTEHADYKLIIRRTEIRSKYADSHLGHILLDGPIENNKIRYCMNSAALNFIPRADLEREGYAEFAYLFK